MGDGSGLRRTLGEIALLLTLEEGEVFDLGRNGGGKGEGGEGEGGEEGEELHRVLVVVECV